MDIGNKIQKEYNNTTGIVVLRNNDIIYEKYFNHCDMKNKVHVYSVTKSIVSILIGIAIEKGYIKSVEQKLVEFYPEYRELNKVVEEITIKDMLIMNVNYRFLIPPYKKYFTSDNWVKFGISLLKKKKDCFYYSPLIGLDILTGILTKVTGMSVLKFAKENLFIPLGIDIKENITFKDKEDQLSFNQSFDRNGWVADPQGVNACGWGLTLSARDMAKIGNLYLNNGIYDDKQIVSFSWIKESTREQNRWRKRNLSYGYLWWLGENGYAAMGEAGNIIYVNNDKKVVVAMTCLFDIKAKDRIEFIEKYIIPNV